MLSLGEICSQTPKTSPVSNISSGVSREGAQGARAPPLALAKQNILYGWNSDDTASAPPWLLSVILFDLEQLGK